MELPHLIGGTPLGAHRSGTSQLGQLGTRLGIHAHQNPLGAHAGTSPLGPLGTRLGAPTHPNPIGAQIGTNPLGPLGTRLGTPAPLGGTRFVRQLWFVQRLPHRGG